MDNDAFPFMGVRQGQIGDIPVMVARLSFSGEMAFEVFCGALHAQTLWDALMRAGEKYSITPYGLEALSTLRIEKGHVAGPELSGRTTAGDLGLACNGFGQKTLYRFGAGAAKGPERRRPAAACGGQIAGWAKNSRRWASCFFCR